MRIDSVSASAIAENEAGEQESIASLPRDHPSWRVDLAFVSGRAQRLLATMREATLVVLGFWEHSRRELRVGEGLLVIDPSGSYRLR